MSWLWSGDEVRNPYRISWSIDGSTSLATLTALRHNSEDGNWLLHHDLRFQFDAATQKPAA